MAKILIFGGSGMLGHKLVQTLSKKNDVWATLNSGIQKYQEFSIFDNEKTFENINIENTENYSNLVEDLKPEVIINAVGIIKQLQLSKDVVKTLTVNSIFPHKLAEIAEKNNARLITFSTDCVFDGKTGNYREEDNSNAVDVYGKSKNLGEVVSGNSLTLRMSIIGRELLSKKSLIEWFLSNSGRKINGYTNAIYTGFPTVILSQIIENVIENFEGLRGLYHVSSNPISKFDLLQIVREKYNLDIEIEPFSDFHIDRSLNSDKFRKETGFAPIKWDEMIEIMAEDNTVYSKKNK